MLVLKTGLLDVLKETSKYGCELLTFFFLNISKQRIEPNDSTEPFRLAGEYICVNIGYDLYSLLLSSSSFAKKDILNEESSTIIIGLTEFLLPVDIFFASYFMFSK